MVGFPALRVMALAAALTLLCLTTTSTAQIETPPTTVSDLSTQYFVKLWANKYPLNYLWTGNDICNYRGIVCDTVKQTVTMLLPMVGLSGTIPSFGSRADFSAANVRVIIINLVGNDKLTGTFPEHYGQLTQLMELYLMGTSLRGTIPQSWNNLPNLANLDVSKTQACGNLPSWDATNMKMLQVMKFDNNPQLRGSIPASLATFRSALLQTTGTPLCGCIPAEFADNMVLLMQLSAQQPNMNAENCATANACRAEDLVCTMSNAAALDYSHVSLAGRVVSMLIGIALLLA